MTDLLADQARHGAPEPPTATRMVLDTSVLISDPDSITAFPDADTVIPLVVVEELDQHKSRMDDVGRAARAVIRAIEELRVAHGGDIRTPVALPGGAADVVEPGLVLVELLHHHQRDHRVGAGERRDRVRVGDEHRRVEHHPRGGGRLGRAGARLVGEEIGQGAPKGWKGSVDGR